MRSHPHPASPQARILSITIKSVLNELRDEALTTSDGRLFHMLTILQLKKILSDTWCLLV